MARIIEKKTNHILPPKTIVCGKCGSSIEFSQGDIKSDQRDGSYVVCPVCNHCINKTQVWSIRELSNWSK